MEIKARAWDGSQMRSHQDIIYCKGFHHWILEGCEGVEVMLFTGWKGKSEGKDDLDEIYDKDIVVEHSTDGDVIILVEWIDQECGFNIGGGTDVCYSVLGNKFENPELLTEIPGYNG